MKKLFISKRRVKKDIEFAETMKKLVDNSKHPFQSTYYDGQIKALKNLLK